MGAKIGSLQLDIGANIASMKSDMGKIEKTVNKSSKVMVKSVDLVKTAFKGMFGMALLKRISDFGTEITDEADKMEELSITTGVTVENLSRLGFVASQSKTDITTLANGLRILGKNVDDTSMGVGQAQTAFKRLGIDVRDSNGELKDIDDLFVEIAGNINNLNSTTEQAAVSQKLFGKSGAQLLPILKRGSEGIREMMEESDRLGATISTEFAKDAGIMNDEITKLNKAFAGLFRAGMGDSAKNLAGFARAMTEVVLAVKAFNESDTGKFISFISSLNAPMALVAKAMAEAKRAKDILFGESEDGFADVDDSTFDGLVDSADEASDKVLKLSSDVEEVNEELEDLSGFEGFDADMFEYEGLITMGESIRDLESALEEVATSSYWDLLEDEIAGPAEAARMAFDEANSAFEESMQTVGKFADGFGNYVSDLTDGTQEDFKDMVGNILKDMLRLQAIELFTNIFAGAFGIKRPESPSVPQLATGGVAMASTFAEIGEGADPEAVLPLARIGGKLGVRAAGGGGAGGLTVNITNNGNNKVTTAPSADGSTLEIMIEDIALQALNSGNADSIMKSRYGVLNQGISR